MPIVRSKSMPSLLPTPPAARLRSMFEVSKHALLENRPLRATSSPAVQADAALSNGELRALAGVGLSTQPWPATRADDPLSQSIVDYMALIETSLTAAAAARLL